MKDKYDKATLDIEQTYPPFIRTAYNYDTNKASQESALVCLEPTRTQQHHKDECDINTIMDRFGITGKMPENVRMPQSADFEDVFDFQSALNQVIQARHAFEQMPAKIRTRFDNDPGKFIKFCDDPENLKEAELLGLVTIAQPIEKSPDKPGKEATGEPVT